MSSYNYSYTLVHHGIKGQRWGIRRYQKKDGSLTPAGKKRYYDTPELNKLKRDLDTAKALRKSSAIVYNKAANRYSNVPTNGNYRDYKQAEARYKTDNLRYKKVKLAYDTDKEVARLQENGIQIQKKSKHRLKLEEKYRQLGMTEEQAQAAANNQIRTEKILAASAGVTVAACAAYVAYKHHKDRIDGVIKAGESLQRIEMRDTGGKLHSVFYAAKGTHDERRYENLLGMARKNATGHAYIMKLQANSDIKVASKDKAIKAFGDLYKNDSDFRDSVKNYVSRHFAGGNAIKDVSDISDRNIKKMYDNFNAAIPNMRGSGADTKFFNKLKSAGYGAIQDINDMKYSGYNARNPLIVFDNSNNNIMVKSVSEMMGNLNKRGTVELMKATGESVAKDFIQKAGPMSAGALTAATVAVYTSDPNRKYAS